MSIVFSNKGKYLASVSEDNSVVLINIMNSKIIHRFNLPIQNEGGKLYLNLYLLLLLAITILTNNKYLNSLIANKLTILNNIYVDKSINYCYLPLFNLIDY